MHTFKLINRLLNTEFKQWDLPEVSKGSWMNHPSKQGNAYFWIVLIIAFFALPTLSFAQTCTGGLTGSNLQDCTGTAASPCHVCDVTDMDVEIRAPNDTDTSGWLDLAYSSESGTCSSACTEEVWTSTGYTYCSWEGTYDARIRAYTNSQWETSDWNIGFYDVNWDSLSGWCSCITGGTGTYFDSVTSGSNANCCGDDNSSDNFHYASDSVTVATSLECSRCQTGTAYGPKTLLGNGYWSGTNLTTDTSGTCFYGNIACDTSSDANGISIISYGNGYWDGTSPTTDTSGTCYYGNITCSDGTYSHGANGTYYGNGYTTSSPTTDLNGFCYFSDINCTDGAASNSTSATVYGNGYDSGTTCYYGDWTCANEDASNGNSCTTACSGAGTTCCPAQNTYRDTVTCSDSGCGYSDHDRDAAQTYCIASTGGCSAYTWDSVGSACCGDDGSGDTFCTAGGGSCINGSWTANHCSDGVKNCDEPANDCGGADCSECTGDQDAPATSHDANQEWQTSNQTITLTCDDGAQQGATGCSNTYYCIDDSNTCNPTTAGTSISITCASNDVNKVYARFYSVDGNSNTEGVQGVYIRIDKNAPYTATNISSSWQDENVSMGLSCDDGTGIGCIATYYRTDDNPSMDTNFGSWLAYSTDFNFGSDGNYLVEYYSKDSLNQTEATKLALVLIDKGFASLGSSVIYSAFEDYNGVIVIPITTDGNHQIDFNSTDLLKNIEILRTGWAALDKTPPSTTDDLNTEWQNSDISITLSCSDAASGCFISQYRLDTNGYSGVSMGAWQTYSGAISITTDGNWAIDYNSKDIAGWHETPNRVYALLDKFGPSVSHDANAEWQNSDQTVTLTATDTTGAGVASVYYCIDDANTCSPGTSGASVGVTCPAGSLCLKYVRYYAADNAGNQSQTSATHIIRIDKEAPTTTDDANTQCQSTDQNVTLSPTDGSGSGIAATYYCIDDSNSCSPSTSGTLAEVTCPAESSCVKYTRYYSTDNAANDETTKSVTITIDDAAPTTTDDANTQWQGSNQSVTLTPSGGGTCGVSATYYCIDTANTCTPTTSGTSVSVTCTVGNVCQKYARYYSIGVSGKTETTKSVLLKIDLQAPTTQHDANTAWQASNQTVNFTVNDSSGAGGDSAYYCIDDANTCSPNLLDSSATVTCDINEVCQKYLRFRGVDYVGNQDEIRAVLLSIDKNAPDTASDVNSAWRSTDHVIYLTPHDTGSGVQFTYYCTDISNSCTPSSNDTSFTIYAIDNQVTNAYARYYSVDNVNNTEGIHSDSVRLDKQKPTTTDDAPSGWQDADVSVTLSPTDGSGSGVQYTYYCIDTANTCTPATSGTSVDVNCDTNSNCQKYVRYYSIDNVNNTETVNSSGVIQIDKNVPYTTDNAPAAWQADNVTVTLTPTDTSGAGIANTYYCTDSANTCTPTTSGTSVNVNCSPTQLCQTYVRYYSTDSAGNTESTKSALVRIDKEKPTTTDDAPDGWQPLDVNVTLTPSDGSGSGIANTYYCTDDSNSCTPGTTYTTPVEFTCAANTQCEYYIRYYSTDNVGNTEDVNYALIQIEKRPPSTSHNITGEWLPDSFTVTLTCVQVSAACDTTTYRLNSGSWTVYSAPFVVSGSGVTQVDFNSTDTIGNVGDVNTAYVRIDRTAPSTTDDANTLWRDSDLSFTLSPSDAQSGVKATYYCTDSTNSCSPDTNSTSVNVTCPADSHCNKYVRYYSIDDVNNTESTHSLLVRIDKRNPVCVADAPTGCVNLDFNVILTCYDQNGAGRHIIQYQFDDEGWLDSPELSTIPSDWWDLNWPRRKKILFDNSGESQKDNYSVLLRLNSSNFSFLESKTDGSDLRFVDDDHETELEYFVDTFSRSNRDGTVWIKVPQIDAGSTTDHIWMYYSNFDADANQVSNWFD